MTDDLTVAREAYEQAYKDRDESYTDMWACIDKADTLIRLLDQRHEELRDALVDMCHQFAYPTDGPALWTGGLSALEGAFATLGWDDPYPVPERGCDEPGCTKVSTCGTPTENGYKHFCGGHYRARLTAEAAEKEEE